METKEGLYNAERRRRIGIGPSQIYWFLCLLQTNGGGSSPLQNGLNRTSPKENGDSHHAKKEPISPRSGRSSASSTPALGHSKKSEDGNKPPTPKPSTPNGGGAAGNGPMKPGLPGAPFNLPGFPGGPPLGPGVPPFNAENGYRPPFDPHTAMRPQLGLPPAGKP